MQSRTLATLSPMVCGARVFARAGLRASTSYQGPAHAAVRTRASLGPAVRENAPQAKGGRKWPRRRGAAASPLQQPSGTSENAENLRTLKLPRSPNDEAANWGGPISLLFPVCGSQVDGPKARRVIGLVYFRQLRLQLKALI